MIKKYLIACLQEKEKEIPCGYKNTTLTKYSLTYTGYNFLFDTEADAEEEIKRRGEGKMVILPVWVEKQ